MNSLYYKFLIKSEAEQKNPIACLLAQMDVNASAKYFNLTVQDRPKSRELFDILKRELTIKNDKNQFNWDEIVTQSLSWLAGKLELENNQHNPIFPNLDNLSVFITVDQSPSTLSRVFNFLENNNVTLDYHLGELLFQASINESHNLYEWIMGELFSGRYKSLYLDTLKKSQYNKLFLKDGNLLYGREVFLDDVSFSIEMKYINNSYGDEISIAFPLRHPVFIRRIFRSPEELTNQLLNIMYNQLGITPIYSPFDYGIDDFFKLNPSYSPLNKILNHPILLGAVHSLSDSDQQNLYYLWEVLFNFNELNICGDSLLFEYINQNGEKSLQEILMIQTARELQHLITHRIKMIADSGEFPFPDKIKDLHKFLIISPLENRYGFQCGISGIPEQFVFYEASDFSFFVNKIVGMYLNQEVNLFDCGGFLFGVHEKPNGNMVEYLAKLLFLSPVIHFLQEKQGKKWVSDEYVLKQINISENESINNQLYQVIKNIMTEKLKMILNRNDINISDGRLEIGKKVLIGTAEIREFLESI